jgi:hypothetical protein
MVLIDEHLSKLHGAVGVKHHLEFERGSGRAVVTSVSSSTVSDESVVARAASRGLN